VSLLEPARPRSRRVRKARRGLPLRLSRVPLIRPISTVDGPYFGSGSFYVRVSAVGGFAVLLLGILLLRLWSLQVIQGPRYAVQAARQTFRLVDLPAPRGPIVDAHGRLLAGTDGRLSLTADAAKLGKVARDGTWRPNKDGVRLLRRVAQLSGESVPRLVRHIDRSLTHDPFAPAVVISSLAKPLAFYLEERSAAFPGLTVAALPRRSYPQGALGAEYLGLLGEISPAQLRERRYRGYIAGEPIGQSGVESTYDRLLNGGFVRKRVTVDARGRILGSLRSAGVSRNATGLQLTIDARIQRAAEKAIRDGIASAHLNGHGDASAGAAVVLDPRDGSVLALASYPGYSQVAAARDQDYLSRLLTSGALLNRATQGLYPAGSTFKPFVAEAALQAGLITPSSYLPCTGSLTVGNIVFHNVEPGINASLNLPQAIAISCDTWFYRLGTSFYWRQQKGELDIQRWAQRFGFGNPTGIDVPGEYGGLVPTPAWLERTFKAPWQRIWYEGYSVNLSIGQGSLAITPLQLAVAYAAIANGGTVVRPHLGRAVLGPSDVPVRPLRFKPARRLKLVGLSAIREGLYNAAHAAGGTSAAIFGSFPVPVAGKTGTAETPRGSDHSWYASYAPAAHPRYVVVVLIEHGGFGAQAAAPAAKEIYSALFHVR
jgi:penicillin-binding protein 2